jgi:hypothetical protein
MKKTKILAAAVLICSVLIVSCASKPKTAKAPVKIEPAKTEQTASAPVPPDKLPPSLPSTAQDFPPPLPPEALAQADTPWSDITGKIWRLIELRVGGGSTVLDRDKMKADGQQDNFILQFDDNGANGVGAPNRYFAPYNTRTGHTVTLRQIQTTGEISTVVTGGLMEQQYFFYLQRVSSWEYKNGRLLLHAPYLQNQEAVLVFAGGAGGNVWFGVQNGVITTTTENKNESSTGAN